MYVRLTFFPATAICDAPSCYEPGYSSKGLYAQCCYGHNEFDQLLGNITLNYRKMTPATYFLALQHMYFANNVTNPCINPSLLLTHL